MLPEATGTNQIAEFVTDCPLGKKITEFRTISFLTFKDEILLASGLFFTDTI